MKAIGVKMVDIMPMSVSMALEHGYRVGNANPNDMGYEITYPDGYKSWCPKDVADASYFCLSPENDGTKILEQDVDNFITAKRGNRIGNKTTLMSLLTITGYECHGLSTCVDENNYNQEIGEKFALEKAKDAIWNGLGFVLQWAKYGLKRD